MKRYYVLDLIRGIALASMIVYHAVWDLVYIKGFDWAWFTSGAAHVWQQSICMTFIILSGFCFSIGKRQLRRGITVSAGGLLVTAVTMIFMPGDEIVFGILTLLGFCMLVMILFCIPLRKCNSIAGAAVSVLLFVLSLNVNDGYIGIGDFRLLKLPEAMYRNLFTAFWGFPPPHFYSSDYFSVFPWIFLFIAGYFLYRIFAEKNKLGLLERKSVGPLEKMGKHSFEIYLVHQPVLMLLFSIIH